ncbi:MAG: hypothetical protein RI554_10575 [Trueperaceae bacterium]|nr:hypothetical protein [Trueperaceae bacterium]
MIHRRLTNYVAAALALSVLGVVGAQATPVTSQQLDAEDRVTSASDTVTADVTYQFVNSVTIGTGEVGGLTIAGADTFASVDAGSISYSFANDATELYAEIIEVNGAAYSPTDNDLSAWWKDDQNHLEFGIGPTGMTDADDFNNLTNGEIASLFPASASVGNSGRTQGVGLVRLDSKGDGDAFVFERNGTPTEDLNEGAGGQRTEAFRYYIAQRGDGPDAGFGNDDTSESTDAMSVTVQFTVAPRQ